MLLADWVAPDVAFLAIAGADMQVRTGAQLFGSATQVDGGGLAPDGFAALAQFDRNADGVIDATDPVFGKLVAWFDRDGDGASDAGEIVPLASLGVIRLDLAHHTLPRMSTGAQVGLDGTFAFRATSGALVEGELADVFFPAQP